MKVETELEKIINKSNLWIDSIDSDESIQNYIKSRNTLNKLVDFLDTLESKGLFGFFGDAIL